MIRTKPGNEFRCSRLHDRFLLDVQPGGMSIRGYKGYSHGNLVVMECVLSDFAPTGSTLQFPPFTNPRCYSPREVATVSHPTPKSQFGAKSDRTLFSATHAM